MNPALSAMRALALASRAASAVSERDPISRIDWFPPQLAFLQDTARIKLLRAGNQLGKSIAGLTECIWLALGIHPWQPGRRCKIIWVVTTTAPQGLAIQEKMWSLVPKDEIHPRTKFDPINGLGRNNPTMMFRNGSIIRFRTSNQGASGLQGASVDHILCDEPPSTARVFGELTKRIQATGGTLSLTLTPINGPVKYLQEMCSQGGIKDLHFRLTVENCTHVKSGRLRILRETGQVFDQAFLDQIRKNTNPAEDPVVNDGEWELKSFGRAYPAWNPTPYHPQNNPTGHLIDHIGGNWFLSLGIDHSLSAGRQAAVLVGVQEQDEKGRDLPEPRVCVFGEYRPTGFTTAKDDAAGLLALLADSGFTWGQLDYCYGDRSVGNKGGAMKSNMNVMDALARLLGHRDKAKLHPQIRGAKAGYGNLSAAMDQGVRWIYEQQVRPGHFLVSAKCKELIESFNKWNGTSTEVPEKDLLDACRYALHPWTWGERKRKRGAAKIRNW